MLTSAAQLLIDVLAVVGARPQTGNDRKGSTVNISDSDFRRASALLLHFANNDAPGVDAILDEAEQDGRLRQLAWCIPAVVMGRQAGWDSDRAKQMLQFTATWFAAREVAE